MTMAPEHTPEDRGESPEEPRPQNEDQNDQEEQQPSTSGSTSTSKSPEPSSSSPSETPATSEAPSSAAASQWQAVWAPQYNAYYFYNPTTQETTWTNPLQPDASSSSDPSTAASSSPTLAAPTDEADPDAGSTSSMVQPTMTAAAAHQAALQAAALAQGIDPLLAHLDPSLLASSVPGSSVGPGDLPTFTAKFNARTGQFAPVNSRTPGHLSEHERARRMSEFYFDVGKWEEDLARRGGRLMGEEGVDEEAGEAGKKRKRPSKKDIERFKEQKKQKKIAKTAWLRT